MTLRQTTDACMLSESTWLLPPSASWLLKQPIRGLVEAGLSLTPPLCWPSEWDWRLLMDQGGSEQPGAEEPDSGGRAEREVSRRASEPDHGLSKITHNALENMGALSHGLKQFFQPQRRRSSVSPHDYASSSIGPIPEPPEAGPELGEAPAIPNSDPHASAPPAALSRVLQQIRGPPMMKRGTSLQSRRSKAGGGGEPPQKGSPQIHRRSTQETLLQAGRPRSSSTTDTPTSPALVDMLLTSGYHSTEESDRVSATWTPHSKRFLPWWHRGHRW